MKAKGYISSRPLKNGIMYDQSIQNLVIRNYCERNNYFFLLSSTEYIMKDCYKMLNQVIYDYNDYDCIIFFSYQQLPKLDEIKNDFTNLLKKKKFVCFAYENVKVKSILEFNDLIHEIKISNLLKFSPIKI
jgi:sporadic carbohydrate cluster protein (TIGR04323 family)